LVGRVKIRTRIVGFTNINAHVLGDVEGRIHVHLIERSSGENRLASSKERSEETRGVGLKPIVVGEPQLRVGHISVDRSIPHHVLSGMFPSVPHTPTIRALLISELRDSVDEEAKEPVESSRVVGSRLSILDEARARSDHSLVVDLSLDVGEQGARPPQHRRWPAVRRWVVLGPRRHGQNVFKYADMGPQEQRVSIRIHLQFAVSLRTHLPGVRSGRPSFFAAGGSPEPASQSVKGVDREIRGRKGFDDALDGYHQGIGSWVVAHRVPLGELGAIGSWQSRLGYMPGRITSVEGLRILVAVTNA
jgi:hypothetical protein